MIEQQRDNACFLQFNSFLNFPNLIHGVFTRDGGYSDQPYKGLNTLGSLRGGDNLDNVIRNRQLALHSLALDGYPCVTLWNIHGADVFVPDIRANWRTDWAHRSYYEQTWTPQEIHKGDALITRQRGVAIALSFADCTPIALYDPIEQVIGVAHGGWRGTARGIVLATIDAMSKHFGSLPRNIYAGIGPTIGPCCYEVSQTVQDLFMGVQHFDDIPTQEQYRSLVRESAVFSVVSLPAKESLRLDLWETNRRQLLMAGLVAERIEVAEICTSCHVDRFFSHRAEHSKTGRFPMIMALAEE
ncbi:MAG: peptidoglycan editing factor PgeF [Ktedonobacteraceae bacterium]